MESELLDAVADAAGRADVRAKVNFVYQTLADEISHRRPVCDASGKCCNFDQYGHRLYVTTLELATFARESTERRQLSTAPGGSPPLRRQSLPVYTPPSSTSAGGCRFQVDGLCSVHAIRPFGCRIYFCDPTSTQWQYDLYERLHNQFRRLHEELNVPYHYVEWRHALKVCFDNDR